jgi:hypothetical protein
MTGDPCSTDDLPIFGIAQEDRTNALLTDLRRLTTHHANRCDPYRNILGAVFPDWKSAEVLEDQPYLPVDLFKRSHLSSVPDGEVFKTVVSSGTTGRPSRVVLDRATAARQTRTLASIMSHVLGNRRRPMLIVDTEAIIRQPSEHTARAAGVLGMMALGRKHAFLLDSEMRVQRDRLTSFLRDTGDEPLLIFGFTFMVWRHLMQELGDAGVDLSAATLIHSGGWKKMEEQRVGNDQFKASLADTFGLRHVVNFYGMAEQVGSVFLEDEDGLLHPSTRSGILIRDPQTFEVVPEGHAGLIQVCSTLPTSYPGHSILTEDLGVIDSVNGSDSKLGGPGFRVLGRMATAELRGCSDTYAEAA